MQSSSLNARVVDATLREGLQAPGVRLTTAACVEIAEGLRSLAVDMIECGHPSVGHEEQERVRAVVVAAGPVPVLSHARARPDDIDAVRATGAAWVGMFLGVNRLALATRVRLRGTPAAAIADAVTHAKDGGLRVRFTVEDASRTEWTDLVEAYRVAIDAGADRICFSDTVGALCPWEVEAAVTRLCDSFPGVELEVHLHDDRGMANANALSAVRAGASWVSASVNGIGERCGITDTITFLANAAHLGWRAAADGPLLQQVSRVVQARTGLHVDRWRPMVGAAAFTHTAKLHRDAVALDETAYSWTAPSVLGRSTAIASEAAADG